VIKDNSNNRYLSSRQSPATGSNAISILGPDGKLTKEEYQRRLNNKECLICGLQGHRRDQCPKNMSRPAGKLKKLTATATFSISTPAKAKEESGN
jgi:hypothetical protein